MSHKRRRRRRRDVMIARLVFALICVVIIAIIAAIIIAIASHNRKNDTNTESQGTEMSSEPIGGSENLPNEEDTQQVYVPSDTEVVEEETFCRTTTAVRLRKEPSLEAVALLLLPEFAEMKYLSEDNGWTEVEYEGTHGYVASDYVETISKEPEEPDTQTPETQEITSSDRAQYTVVLDAGHQAHGDSKEEPVGPGATTTKKRVTSGTKGTTTGVYEFQLNLDIALKLQTELESRGYVVKMTRTTHDVNLSNKERAEFAAQENGNILVRIHANGSESSDTNGALALAPSASNPFIASLSDPSLKLSKCILNSYCDATGMANHGVKANDTMSGINWSTIPVTIFEMGYMTNPEDDKNMQDAAFQAKMVQGIADGIDNYFFK